MALEDMDKKYRISDIARELQVSPQEVLRFVKARKGPGLASTSSMVDTEMHGLILGQFSDERRWWTRPARSGRKKSSG